VRAGDYWVRRRRYRVHVYLTPAGVEVTVSEGTVNVVNATANESPPSDTAIGESAAAVTAGEQADVHGRAEVIHELIRRCSAAGWPGERALSISRDQPLG